MAENKNYAKWIDIPDGSGGAERKWLADDDARSMILSIAEEVQTIKGAISLISNAFVTETGKWHNALLWGNDMVWPDGYSVKNTLIRLHGWDNTFRWEDSMTWPEGESVVAQAYGASVSNPQWP